MKKHLFTTFVFVSCSALVYACGGDDTTTPVIDSGTKDTSVADTSTNKDSSLPDTSVVDSSIADTSVGDTSTVLDAADVEAGPTNGCINFDDHTAQNDARLITFPGVNLTPVYSINCMKIAKGQKVTWTADNNVTFGNHPLTSENEVGTPIVNTSTGTTVSFTFNQTGTFGFHCLFHPGSMKGAIFVQ
jgi:plastocyanin